MSAPKPPMWAPWRMEYILGPKDKSRCIFCVYGAEQPDQFREDLVVFANAHAYVVLNRYPFAAGHVMVVPRAHVSEPWGLEPAAHDALFRLVSDVAVRLKDAVNAGGVNVGINVGEAAGAGIAEHLHVHIVPRWPSDTNFMPVIADVRVMPQMLDSTWKHVAAALADLPGQHPPLP
ncbi:MAG: HIT domain-containing protein [Polyangiaceae bacterium]|nr:HIT domain-containing protein [Polyangiaceae bacterium]